MVGVELNGRLGNQLFQYAFIKNLSKKIKKKYLLVNSEYFLLNEYFELPFYDKLVHKKILSTFFTCIFLNKEVEYKNEDDINVIATNGTIYKGFFQSTSYFDNNIKLKIKEKYLTRFWYRYGNELKKNVTISIHIRQTDYIKHTVYGLENVCVPILWFKKNLIKLLIDYPYAIVYILSDDIETIKPHFIEFDNIKFSNENLITDFLIIQNTDFSIISNSSFSWWARYLSEKEYKKTIAPKYWLGFKSFKEYPNGIMRVPYTWLDVL